MTSLVIYKCNQIILWALQVKRRKQELKHAQDVKELYEKKLERVNDLFMELNAWKLQLVRQLGGQSQNGKANRGPILQL
jgi:hypothetical protein